MKKTVGIIGGMGPVTTIDLMTRVVDLTPAENEQDNIRMLVDNRPEIPDRIEFFDGYGASPAPYLIDSAKLLEKWGADFIAIACNTAHIFYKEIRDSVSVPVLNLPEILVRSLIEKHNKGSEIILLATNSTIKTGLYSKYLTEYKILIPDENSQKNDVMEAIFGEKGIKKTHETEWGRDKLIKAVEKLKTENTKAVIAGCTEISLAFKNSGYDVPVLDPLEFLAKRIVEKAVSVREILV